MEWKASRTGEMTEQKVTLASSITKYYRENAVDMLPEIRWLFEQLINGRTQEITSVRIVSKVLNEYQCRMLGAVFPYLARLKQVMLIDNSLDAAHLHLLLKDAPLETMEKL